MDIKQVQKKFGSQVKCLKFMEKLRCGKTVKCPYCDSKRIIKAKHEQGRYKCYNCTRSFSPLIGTIYQDTKLPLSDWFLIATLVLNAKMGISAKQISRQTGISLKSSWLNAMKLRCAMIDNDTQLHGILEMDESYFSRSRERKIP